MIRTSLQRRFVFPTTYNLCWIDPIYVSSLTVDPLKRPAGDMDKTYPNYSNKWRCRNKLSVYILSDFSKE